MNNAKKLKICHVLTSFDAGGATENTFTRINSLCTKYDFFVAAGKSSHRYNSFEADLKKKGVIFYDSKFLSNNINPIKDFFAVLELYRFFKKNSFDVVHTHNTKAGILGRIAAIIASIPKIIHEVHGLPFTRNPIIFKVCFFLEKVISKYTDFYLIVSQGLLEKFYSVSNVPKSKTIFLPTTIFFPGKLSQAKARKTFGLKQREKAVGMIARFDRFKRHDLFLETAKKILKKKNNVKFFLIGDGVERKKIETEIVSSGFKGKIKMLGFIEPEKVPFFINAFDVVLHTSEKDSISRAIIQAMFLEKPVVCFDVGEIGEIIANGENGFAVEFADTEKAAEKTLFLLENPSARKQIGRNARKAVSEIFQLEKNNALLQKIYEA